MDSAAPSSMFAGLSRSVFVVTFLIACSQEPTGSGSGQAEQPAAQTSKAPQPVANAATLMPQPGSITFGDGWLRVTGFQIQWAPAYAAARGCPVEM